MEVHIRLIILGFILIITGLIIISYNHQKISYGKDKEGYLLYPTHVTETKEWIKWSNKLSEITEVQFKDDNTKKSRELVKRLIKEADSLEKLIPYDKFK